MAETSTPSSSKNYTTQIMTVLLIVAAFAIGMLWQKNQNLQSGTGTAAGAGTQQAAAPAEQPSGEVAPVTEADLVRGDANAPITWIEYSDLECPFCSQIHPDLVKLMEEYNGQVRWVYRHFPLDQLHPNARELAQGSFCASEQGGDEAGWDFIDYVFTNKSTDPNAVASALGLNTSVFSTCLTSEAAIARINTDYESGLTAGVRGTPGNIVIGPDGQKQVIPGALPYEQLKAVVDGML